MAMQLGGGGKGFIAEINVTPFVDVMLVLLIIFMVTAPMMMAATMTMSTRISTAPSLSFSILSTLI